MSDVKTRIGAVLALAALATVFAGDALASPYLSMSLARQRMQGFVASQLVGSMEQRGLVAEGKINSCWRVSSGRVNCHVTLDDYDEVGGSEIHGRCSGTWTAFKGSGWFRIKNVTWACKTVY